MRPAAAKVPKWLLLALSALLPQWPAASAWELTILHTNDVHSRLEQTSDDSTKCLNASLCVGGVARLFTKVQQIRKEEPNVLFLDAGDQYQGTIWFTVYKGLEVAHFMNILGYDAMALGNHEFDNGVEGLIDPLLRNVKFPILSANIKARGPLAHQISGLFLPSKVLSVGGEVVGIVGYTSKETPFLSNPASMATELSCWDLSSILCICGVSMESGLSNSIREVEPCARMVDGCVSLSLLFGETLFTLGFADFPLETSL